MPKMDQARSLDFSVKSLTTGDSFDSTHVGREPGAPATAGHETTSHGLRWSVLDLTNRADSKEKESFLPQIGFVSATEDSTMGFVRGISQSFGYSLLQRPMEGLSQFFDQTLGKTVGSNLYAHTKDLVIASPKQAASGSAEWYGQAIGEGFGVVPWYLATRAAVRGSFSLVPGLDRLLVSQSELAAARNTVPAGQKLISTASVKMMIESGPTAAAYAALLKPVGGDAHDYWNAKEGQMATDIATFYALTASTIYVGGKLQVAARPLLESSPGVAKVTREAISTLAGAISAVPAVGAQTVTQQLVYGKQATPTISDFGKNLYSYYVTGAALSTGHPMFSAARS
jgi:hypothetical protein